MSQDTIKFAVEFYAYDSDGMSSTTYPQETVLEFPRDKTPGDGPPAADVVKALKGEGYDCISEIKLYPLTTSIAYTDESIKKAEQEYNAAAEKTRQEKYAKEQERRDKAELARLKKLYPDSV